jgi:hypothetical protein
MWVPRESNFAKEFRTFLEKILQIGRRTRRQEVIVRRNCGTPHSLAAAARLAQRAMENDNLTKQSFDGEPARRARAALSKGLPRIFLKGLPDTAGIPANFSRAGISVLLIHPCHSTHPRPRSSAFSARRRSPPCAAPSCSLSAPAVLAASCSRTWSYRTFKTLKWYDLARGHEHHSAR